MTELDLYKFLVENEVETDWRDDKLYAWLSHWDVDKFCEMLDRCDADDGGIDCKLQNGGTVVLDLVEICEDYDIDPERITEREAD